MYGKVVTFPGVKWPEREADHSLPSSAEVKTVWNCTSTPPYAFIPWTGTIISKGLWKEVIVSYLGTIVSSYRYYSELTQVLS